MRRRSQLENLLLLLLRMAAIALLALALARPFTGGGGPLAALTETRHDLLLVLDASASTDYRDGVHSVHERIVERARELCRDLDRSRGDRVRLVRAASVPSLVAWRTPDEALAALAAFSEAAHEPMNFASALAEVARLVTEDSAEGDTGELEIVLLTDLQHATFAPSGAAAGDDADAVVEQLDLLQGLGAQVLVEDLGPAEPIPPNLAVQALIPLGPVLGPGAPIDVAVEIANHGQKARTGVRVALAVDGERRPSQLIDVPARGSERAVFPVVFSEAGARVLEASLQGDRLQVDDARAHVIEVPDTLRVLLVDGQPDPSDIERDAVGLLAAVLDPPGDDPGTPAPFRATVVTESALGTNEVDLAEQDVIWLANVAQLPPHVVELLEQRVAAGAGLVISVGANVDPDIYRAMLWRADGSGLLPAELSPGVHTSPREGYFRPKGFEEEHPSLSFFADERWRMLLTEAPIFGFLPARPVEGARVLAWLDDEGEHPLLVERSYARGRVLLWTTTIDPSWTLIPRSPRTLVPLAHEILRHLARPPAAPRNLAVGEAPIAEVQEFPREPVLVSPAGGRSPLGGEPTPLAEGVFRLPTAPPLDAAGSWRIELANGARLPFAAQLEPRESDLSRATAADLPTHAALAIAGAGSAGTGADLGPEGRGELWRTLAIACLIALVLESLWSAWLGHKRRMP